MKKTVVLVVFPLFLAGMVSGQYGEPPAKSTDIRKPEEAKPPASTPMTASGPVTEVLSLTNPYAAPPAAPTLPRSEWSYPEEPIPRRVGTAVAEVMGINFLVWGFGHYLMDDAGGAHTYINLDTMRDNFTYWFEWDPNHFATNFFAHPYHGSLYFNAGRTNGLDYWASGFTAFMGSFMWETVMEYHRPSVNDLIMTTTGGMFLGEALFRLSNLILDDSATGWNRAWRELAGALLNPLGGLNRLIYGDMFTTRSSVNHIRAPLQLHLSWSGSLTSDNFSPEDAKASPSLDGLVIYGQAFKDAADRKPLDFFPLEFTVRRTNGQMYFSIYAYGLLVGREFGGRERQRHLVGLFQHYDYIYNEAIEIGGTSFCPGIISQFQLSPESQLTVLAHLGWMMLGASKNEYVGTGAGTSGEGIDYNYSTGWTAKLDLALDLQKYGTLLARWAHYSLYTLEGVDGTDRLNLFQGRYLIPVWKGLSVGAKFTHYRRNSHYEEGFEDVKQRLYSFSSLISYRF